MWSSIEGKLIKLFLLSSDKCLNKQLLNKNESEKFHRSGISIDAVDFFNI